MVLRGIVAVCLFLLTPLAGAVYVVTLYSPKRFWLVSFVGGYLALTFALFTLSSDPLPLTREASESLQLTSPIYRWLNRDFVAPELQTVAIDLAQAMDLQFPGTITLALDGGLPINGPPLIPHLSHDDGEKLDFALYWQDEAGVYLPGVTKSPIGYRGYVAGQSDCPKTWADLRWDFTTLQHLLPPVKLDEVRTRAALLWLADDPRVSKILIEPHIVQRLGISHPKIRFQGCRAARHDDHIHVQL